MKNYKLVLLVAVLVIVLVVLFVSNPIRNKCDNQADSFLKGINKSFFVQKDSTKKHRIFPMVGKFKNKCTEANSPAACDDYFQLLSEIAYELKFVENECLEALGGVEFDLEGALRSGIKIMALVAWGAKPPQAVEDKIGWLNMNQLKTFCALVNSYELIFGAEQFADLKNKIYSEYPDEWPAQVSMDQRDPGIRPRALKTQNNVSGQLDLKAVYEKSLFSLPCQRYL